MFPKRPLDHYYAALDIRGLAFGGYDDPQVAGSWKRFVDEVMTCGGEKAVVSHELLAAASTEQIASVLGAFEPAEVHVIYGARDLARQLPAVWQESVKNRRTRPYKSFLRAVLGKRGEARPNAGFWTAQDPLRSLARWAAYLPPERIHVVTLPPGGAPVDLLWQRFCRAMGVDPTGFDLDVARTNTSLTQADAEVLRQLNRRLSSDLQWPDYERLVKQRFNQLADRGVDGDRLRVPRRFRERLLHRTEEVRSGLVAASYDIVGDLDDLLPVDDAFGPVRQLSSDQVADTAVDLLAVVLQTSTSAAQERRANAKRLLVRLRRRGER